MASSHSNTASPGAPEPMPLPSPGSNIGPVAEQSAETERISIGEMKPSVLPHTDSFFSYSSAVSTPGADHIVTLIKVDKKSKQGETTSSYVPVQRAKFENNIYRAIGFLELGNASDVGANIFNDTPVPIYAIVLMAVGGTVAGIMSIVAFMDSRLAWRNIRFLRQQRRGLKDERGRRSQSSQSTRDLDVMLAVSFRELGSETINRWALDIFMGGGAVLISIGTYMAIGGNDQNVWFASNILSGYLGNAPIALYGLVNFCWGVYIFCKAQGHVNAAVQFIPGSRSLALIRRRSRTVQTFAAINGTATIIGGIGSMITATRWWGYVILIPVIMSSVFCNYLWRSRVGYTRRDPVAAKMPEMSVDELTTALEFAARAEHTIREHGDEPIQPFVADPMSLRSVIEFLCEHELFEQFCLGLVKKMELCAAICTSSCRASDGDNNTEITIDTRTLLAVPEALHPAMINVAQELVRKIGPQHFRHRERYAAELLGTYLALSRQENANRTVEAEPQDEKRVSA